RRRATARGATMPSPTTASSRSRARRVLGSTFAEITVKGSRDSPLGGLPGFRFIFCVKLIFFKLRPVDIFVNRIGQKQAYLSSVTCKHGKSVTACLDMLLTTRRRNRTL